MGLALIALLATLCLFVGMLIFSEVGRRIGIARFAGDGDGEKGSGAAEGAMFALLGLLIAFSFSGAASRFEDRKDLIAVEANAIGTAYLRVDLLPADAQPELKALFGRYLDVRAAIYRNVLDEDQTALSLAEATSLQSEIWTKALTACQRPDASAQAAILVLPALNEMIDITTNRAMATRKHPPLVIFFLLGGLSLVGALLVGYATSQNKRRSWFHTIIFAAVLSLTVYVIVDLEFPRAGLIRVDAADEILFDLRKTMR